MSGPCMVTYNCVYNHVNVCMHHFTMGVWSSKEPEPVTKVDGVNTVDNSFSVINIHQTTVAYMSLIVVFIVAIIILVYIYFKRGGLHCCLGE